MADITCPHCKTTNRGTAQFCSECGMPLLHGLEHSDSGLMTEKTKPLPERVDQSDGGKPEIVLQNRYRIGETLGRGGFGSVYLAWDLNLNRACAIKENLAVSAEAQRQFMREATVLANLSHSNLPRVIDHFIVPEVGQYLVMDFVEGEDLETILEKREIVSLEDALEWIQQVAGALDYLHRQKPAVFHRDIKPANIRITPNGQAMLVDFGLVKVFDGAIATTVGARAITPGYAPPEQYGRGGTDARTDIYALGATFYHLITGHEPMESVQRLAGEHLPSAHSLNPNIPLSVSDVIEHAMAVDPANRFQSAAEFRAALHAAQVALSQTKTDKNRETVVVAAESFAPQVTGLSKPPGAAMSSGPAPTEKIDLAEGIAGPTHTVKQDLAGGNYPSQQTAPRAEKKPRSLLWIVGIGGLVGLILCVALAAGLSAMLFNDGGDPVSETLTARARLNSPVESTLTARALNLLAATNTVAVTPEGDRTATPVKVENATATKTKTKAPTAAPSKTSTSSAKSDPTALAREAYLAEMMKKAQLVYGPKSGRILHKEENGFIETLSASIGVRNFITEVTIVNPYSASEGTWDFGILFRHGGSNVQYRLVFQADKTWVLTNHIGSADGKVVAEGSISSLKTGAGDANTIRLYAIEDQGYLYFNDVFIDEFDISKHYSGGIMIGIGFYKGAEKTGKLTEYEDFTVWSLPTNP